MCLHQMPSPFSGAQAKSCLQEVQSATPFSTNPTDRGLIMSEETINVIDFTTRRPVTFKPYEKIPLDGCDHRHFVLDEVSRTVECGKCGKAVDAFLALRILADDCQMRDYRLNEWTAYLKDQKERKDRYRAKMATRSTPL